MIKAIKTTSIETEIEIPTPFYYKYVSENKSFIMAGAITDESVFEITEERFKDPEICSFEITINSPDKENIFPYMYENPITKEEFENYYYSVMHKISRFSDAVREEF